MRPSDDAVYAHAININVAGKGSQPSKREARQGSSRP
jgi:hypothetical protein